MTPQHVLQRDLPLGSDTEPKLLVQNDRFDHIDPIYHQDYIFPSSREQMIRVPSKKIEVKN